MVNKKEYSLHVFSKYTFLNIHIKYIADPTNDSTIRVCFLQDSSLHSGMFIFVNSSIWFVNAMHFVAVVNCQYPSSSETF